MLARAIENDVGKAFDLAAVGVGVLAERATVAAVFRRKALDLGRLVEPGQVGPAVYAAVLAVDAKSALEVAPDGDGQVQVSDGAVREVDRGEPAVGAELLDQSGLNARDLAA